MHTKSTEEMRADARKIYFSGLQAVEPGAAVKKYCWRDGNRLWFGERIYDLSVYRNIYVLGAGKATAPMAAAIEELLKDRITGGLINVKYGHVCALDRIDLVEAGHPVPDESGAKGACVILSFAQTAEKDDLVICLMSGGGSALLPLPAAGVSLKDKKDTIGVLLSCGATIHEINAVRKHNSAIKGGQLAKAVYPASLATLILSDVVGDDLDVIASGPTVPDTSTFGDAMKILKKYGLIGKLPNAVVRRMAAGMAGDLPETPKAGDPVFKRVYNLIIGSNCDALAAAANEAQRLGYTPLILSSMIEGEAREVSRVHGAIVREIRKTENPASPPACILSGGETTVTVTGNGLGGRCQEFALAAAIDISGDPGMVVLCAGTDGTDGPTDAAGAIADGGTIRRAEAAGLNAPDFLSNNDAYHFFKSLQDLVLTGPTNTNVMDLHIFLVG